MTMETIAIFSAAAVFIFATLYYFCIRQERRLAELILIGSVSGAVVGYGLTVTFGLTEGWQLAVILLAAGGTVQGIVICHFVKQKFFNR